MATMEGGDASKSLYLGAIPSGIPVLDVLSRPTLKGLGMMLNLGGTLTNWKDVADKLGYSMREIEGYFALRTTEPGDPCYSVLVSWSRNGKGTISQLCQVFMELELNACLAEIQQDLDKYMAKLNKKEPTEGTVQNPGSHGHHPSSGGSSLMENSETPPSLDDSLPTSFSSSELSDDYSLRLPSASSGSGSFSGESVSYRSNQPTTELESFCESAGSTSGKVCTEQTDSSHTDGLVSDNQMAVHCGDTQSQAESSSSSATCSGNDRGKEPAAVITQPLLYRLESCPANIQRPSPSPSPPQQRSKGKRSKTQIKKSISVEEGRQGKKKSRFSRFSKYFKKQKKAGKKIDHDTDQVVVNSKSKTFSTVTVEDVYEEEAEKQIKNFSPIVKTPSASTGSTRQEVVRQDSSSSEECQASHGAPRGRESGYSSEENNYHPPTPSKMNSSKRLFVLCHKELLEKADEVYDFFHKQGYTCKFHAMDPQKGPYNSINEQLCKANFVLICLSPGLKEAFEDLSSATNPDDDDRALKSASNLMVSEMGFHCQNPNGKYMPILFSKEAMQYVPFSLLQTMKYNWDKDQTTMISVINGESQVPRSNVSKAKYVPKSKQVRSYSGI